jgi:hypothetical protein
MTLLLTLAVVMCAAPVLAAPDLRHGRQAGPLLVYPDDAKRSVFYFPPGDLMIAATEEGAPDIHLIHARYTGSASTGDRGVAVVRSVFSVRLIMNGPTRQEIESARIALTASAGGRIELRPLPIRRIESAIVFAAADRSEGSPAPGPVQVLPPGHFEETEDASVPREGYWTERIYTLGLGAADAQLLSDALERGRHILSVGYAFLAHGIGTAAPLEELSGSPELVAALRKQLRSSRRAPAAGDANQQTEPIVVRAGAVAATADLARWPRIVRRFDINATAPPGYAALDVYCYDFNEAADSNRYETQVEIQAVGVSGAPVTLRATFSRTQPDLYARSLRFPVAVRMDRPYRFRVHAISSDGTAMTSSWRERTSWAELLDVTTQGEPQ